MVNKTKTPLNFLRMRGLKVVIEGGQTFRVSPNDRVDGHLHQYIKNNKASILGELFQELERGDEGEEPSHQQKKAELRKGRVEIFRILLRRFLNDEKCRAMVQFKGPNPVTDKALEAYLDSELVNFEYAIEEAITMYRHYTPPAPMETGQCRCGYNPPFCACKNK